jgi:hypothetical protein
MPDAAAPDRMRERVTVIVGHSQHSLAAASLANDKAQRTRGGDEVGLDELEVVELRLDLNDLG